MSNPVPRSLATRRPGTRGPALIRTPRTLPRILNPKEVNALMAALRTHRDRAMVDAMLLGGLRRCEVLGLRFEDLRPGENQVFVADGKGGHQRLVPMSPRFFRRLSAYLESERPEEATTKFVFVALKGERRGQPLADDGLDKIVSNAKGRAGLLHCTCHELRHTCLTRLREAGMALEAIQAQAGHRSLESTRLYLHLAQRLARSRIHTCGGDHRQLCDRRVSRRWQDERASGRRRGTRFLRPRGARMGPDRRLRSTACSNLEALSRPDLPVASAGLGDGRRTRRFVSSVAISSRTTRRRRASRPSRGERSRGSRRS